jgi:hypothetical protein
MTRDVPPPGESPSDPANKDIDAVGFALSKVLCNLVWIEEHASSLAKIQQSEPKLAEQELSYLLDSAAQALKHSRRLRDLLMAGYAFNPLQQLPEGLADQ